MLAVDAKAAEEAREAKTKAEQAIPAINEKINALDKILTSPGLNSRVGSTPLGRFDFGLDKLTGADDTFLADVEIIASQETLDFLVNLKAQGGTLGALNQSELEILENSSTRINKWAIKNKKDEVIGYDVPQADFIVEVERLKELATRAKHRALGEALDESENSFIEAATQNNIVFDPTSAYLTPGQFITQASTASVFNQ